MRRTKKDELYELHEKLRLSTSIDKDHILRVLEIMINTSKDKLVSASDINTMMRLQGEVKILDKLRTQLTTAPPSSTE